MRWTICGAESEPQFLQRAAAGSSEASGSLAAKLAKCAESGGSALTPSAVADEMTGLLLAGHETSSNTATWALHLLATHPREVAADDRGWERFKVGCGVDKISATGFV